MTLVMDSVMSRMVCAGFLVKDLKYDRVAGPDCGPEVLLGVVDVGLKEPGTGRV
jgi:hypothetical protein